MNDEKFVSGGIVNTNPTLLVKLFDSSGINTIGNGIGHDLMAIVNENTNQSINLNQYFVGKMDDYMNGEVKYPFQNLGAGNYRLNVKAWDNQNNSSEQSISFVIAENNAFSIKNLLNYPNPFTTSTVFHFDHNRPNEPLKAKIQIYTVSGQLVKTLSGTVNSAGNHNDQFTWDGYDDFGDKIGRGVYLYVLTLQTESGEQTQTRQKMVLLK